jgi:hypothetical protein
MRYRQVVKRDLVRDRLAGRYAGILLSEFDVDGDGSITAEEISDALVEEATERFDELDANDRDAGETTDEEITEEEETTIEAE